MTGENIPYQLRPNKFIDRRLFVELISKLIVPRGVENYIYVSMGGQHLVDHYSIYNQLGIDALYSFDLDNNAVARQKFNRPTGAMICEAISSADLPSQIDTIFQQFPRKTNLIVWLDFTTPDRRAQLQEAVETLARLRHGDIFRITLNASARTLGSEDEWKAQGAESPSIYRADKLREQVSEFLPTEIASIHDPELPSALIQCVRIATEKAKVLKPDLIFHPVLLTSYKDGARMITATCAVSDKKISERFPNALLRRWRFVCTTWQDIQYISAPLLSSKEQYRLDENLHVGPAQMLARLKFLPGTNRNASLEALRSYKKFHRFYPSFRHVED